MAHTRYTAAKRRELDAARAARMVEIDRRLAELTLDDHLELALAGHSLDADGSVRYDVAIPPRAGDAADHAAHVAWITARHAELVARFAA